MKNFDKIMSVILALCLIVAGWLGNNLYRYYNYQKEFNGLWMEQINNKPEALEKAQTYDKDGTWICINIRDSSIKDIQETCIHESMHELWARYCTANNNSKCIDALTKLKGENNEK